MDGATIVSVLVSTGIIGAVGVLFRALMAAKDQQIEWLREDNADLRATIDRLTSTNERAITTIEEAAPVVNDRRRSEARAQAQSRASTRRTGGAE